MNTLASIRRSLSNTLKSLHSRGLVLSLIFMVTTTMIQASYGELLRKEKELKGQVVSTEGLTRPETPYDYNSLDYVDQIYKESTSRFGPTVHDDGRDDYVEDRFEFIGDTEGYRSKAYDDNGFRSVGYGFNIDAPGHKAMLRDVLGFNDAQIKSLRKGETEIDQSQARALFEAAADEAEQIVDNRLKDVDLKRHERLALVSMAYNNPELIGPNLVKKLKSKDKQQALDEILYKSNKGDHRGLAVRRYKEATMFAGISNANSMIPFEKYIQTHNSR